MLYRIMNYVSTTLSEWDSAFTQSFDSATKGGSALIASLRRNLLAEIGHWLQLHVAAVFYDFSKFFDTIKIAELIDRAADTQYPPVDMALALQQHLAPRVIQAEGFSGFHMCIHNSILAGCKQSVSMTRALLYQSMYTLHATHKKVYTGIHVDDIALLASSESKLKVYHRARAASLHFASMARKQRLGLSEKGAIVASDFSLALRLQRELNKQGVPYKAEYVSRDLGLAFNAACKKTYTNLKNRL